MSRFLHRVLACFLAASVAAGADFGAINSGRLLVREYQVSHFSEQALAARLGTVPFHHHEALGGLPIMLMKETSTELRASAEPSRPYWLPSLKDMLALARREGVETFFDVMEDTPIYSRLFRLPGLSLGTRFEMWHGAAFAISLGGLRDFAKSAKWSISQLRHHLDLRMSTRGIIVIKKESEFPQRRTLLEEIFHILANRGLFENPVGLEAVNDFQQLMFFPQRYVSEFHSNYTEWGDELKLALIKRYRNDPGRDPNYDSDQIIEDLLNDVRAHAVLTVGGEERRISDWIHPPKDGSSDTNAEQMAAHLEELSHSHRLRRYKPLFRHWKLVEPTGSRREGDPVGRSYPVPISQMIPHPDLKKLNAAVQEAAGKAAAEYFYVEVRDAYEEIADTAWSWGTDSPDQIQYEAAVEQLRTFHRRVEALSDSMTTPGVDNFLVERIRNSGLGAFFNRGNRPLNEIGMPLLRLSVAHTLAALELHRRTFAGEPVEADTVFAAPWSAGQLSADELNLNKPWPLTPRPEARRGGPAGGGVTSIKASDGRETPMAWDIEPPAIALARQRRNPGPRHLLQNINDGADHLKPANPPEPAAADRKSESGSEKTYDASEAFRGISLPALRPLIQKEVLSRLPRKARILDVAAGRGAMRGLLGDALPADVPYTEIDTNVKALGVPRSHPVVVRHMSLLKLDFEGGTFTTVLALSAIDSFTRDEMVAALKEISGVLTIGGKVICIQDQFPNTETEVFTAARNNQIPLVYYPGHGDDLGSPRMLLANRSRLESILNGNPTYLSPYLLEACRAWMHDPVGFFDAVSRRQPELFNAMKAGLDRMPHGVIVKKDVSRLEALAERIKSAAEDETVKLKVEFTGNVMERRLADPGEINMKLPVGDNAVFSEPGYISFGHVPNLPVGKIQVEANVHVVVLSKDSSPNPDDPAAPALGKPARPLPLNVQEGYRRLAQEADDIARYQRPQGGIFLIGGVAGTGKTTWAESIERYLIKHATWVRVLHLDKFMRPEAERLPFRASVLAAGKPRPDARKFIVDWESLEREARELIDSRPEGGWLIVDGGWPLDAKVFQDHHSETLSFLMAAENAEARTRFLQRDAGQMSPEDFALYYDLAIAPTREEYERATEDSVDAVIDVTRKPEEWRVVPISREDKQRAQSRAPAAPVTARNIPWDPERYAKYREGRLLVAPALRDLCDTHIFNLLESGSRVLEIGAGPGQMVKWLLRDPKVRGLDWEETDANLDVLGQMHGFPTKKRRVILPNLNVADESIDAVVGLAVLDVLTDSNLELTLTNAHNALKLGGRLFHFLDIFPNHIWERVIQEGKIPFPIYQPADYVPLRGLNYLIQTGFHLVDAKLLRAFVTRGGLDGRPRIAEILIPYLANPILREQSIRQSKKYNELDPVIDWLRSFGLIEKTVPSLIDEFNQRLVRTAKAVGFEIEISQEVQDGGLLARNSVWSTLPESINAIVFWHGHMTELFDTNVLSGKIRMLAYASVFRSRKVRTAA